MKSGTRRVLFLIAIAIVAAVLALVPFETTVAPEWKLRVVDESGRPVAGVPIREVWSHNILEAEGGTELMTSDLDGYVRFPRRPIRANFATRAVHKFVNVINPHGASGPTAFILVLSPYQAVESEPYYESGKALAEQIIVRRAH